MVLSIIIVNWNTRNLLQDCLSSILDSDLNFKYEVFVVDNASKDGSVEMVQEHFPMVKVTANEINLGFSKANNQAIKRSSGKYILLLNPDTTVKSCTLAKMVSFMDNHKDIDILGPKILNPDETVQFTCARNFPNLCLEFFNVSKLDRKFPKSKLFGGYLISYWNHLNSREIDLLSGACMLIKKEVFKDIGLLDESFYMFYDDVDFCYRAKRKGYTIYYYADVSIIHYGGGSCKDNRISMQRIKFISYQTMYKYYCKTRNRVYAEIVRFMMLFNFGVLFVSHILLFLISHGKDRTREKKIIKQYLIQIKFFLFFHQYNIINGLITSSEKKSIDKLWK